MTLNATLLRQPNGQEEERRVVETEENTAPRAYSKHRIRTALPLIMRRGTPSPRSPTVYCCQA